MAYLLMYNNNISINIRLICIKHIFFRLKLQTLTINKPITTTDTDPVQNTTRNTE